MSLATASSSAAAALAAHPFFIIDDRAPTGSDGGRLVFCPAALTASDLAAFAASTFSGGSDSTGSDPISAVASSSSSSSAAPNGAITFQRFVRASPPAALVAFFRAVVAEVERPPRAIVDYHLRIVRRDASQLQNDDTRTNQTIADAKNEDTRVDRTEPSSFAFAVEILYGAARPALRHFPGACW
jgi:hypothetical protein